MRRLLRRACRHGRILGIQGAFLADLAVTVIEGSKDGYPELEEKKEFILKNIAKEEEQFNKTIDQGLSILAKMEEDMEKNGTKVLSGEDAFKLYDTFGFPIDLTIEILEEKGFTYDEEGFEKAKAEAKAQSKGTYVGAEHMAGRAKNVYDDLDLSLETTYVGYTESSCGAKITAVTTDASAEDAKITDSLTEGQKGTLILDTTCMYGTMGGQQGDCGVISSENGEFTVTETIHLAGTKVGHVGYVSKGCVKVGEEVLVTVDEVKHANTCKNHSATHLLQKALKTVLGNHVEQKGSLVTPDRLRFDFSHFEAMTAEQIAEVESLVNKEIALGLPVVTDEMSIADAKKTGAMALFGEKYGEKVRVVSMGKNDAEEIEEAFKDAFSVELCGGTHVSNTSTIQSFKLLSESGVAAGVRRIEAITGEGVLAYYADLEKKLARAAELLKTTPDKVEDRITHILAENKALASENESLKSKAAKDALGDVMDNVKDVKGVKLLAAKVPGVEMNGLRDLGDQLKEKLGDGVVVLISDKDGKVNMIAMATDAAMGKGAHAGNLIKGIAALVGGGGGGRPNMAQAGGKNPEGIDAAIAAVEEVLSSQLA